MNSKRPNRILIAESRFRDSLLCGIHYLTLRRTFPHLTINASGRHSLTTGRSRCRLLVTGRPPDRRRDMSRAYDRDLSVSRPVRPAVPVSPAPETGRDQCMVHGVRSEKLSALDKPRGRANRPRLYRGDARSRDSLWLVLPVRKTQFMWWRFCAF